ncbi:MAG: ABC transporter permease [Alphaproteobacteria bacterium]|nr:ABC transporter permease [Alphaproteobacteria bacterium]
MSAAIAFAGRLWRGLEFLLALAVVGLLWHLAALWVGKRNVLPSPAAVASAWLELLADNLPSDALASLAHLCAGYGAGVATGLLLAVACARFAVVEAAVDPLIELLRPIGAIAWIPLAILMFGIGTGVPIFLIFYASTFPVFVNTLAGIRHVDRRLVQAAEMLGASRRMIVTHVVVPAALPLILSGARLSLGVAWASMVAAELTGADAGLGWRIFWYQEFFAMDRVMAVILTIGVLGYLLDLALRFLQRRLTRWSPDSETEAR